MGSFGRNIRREREMRGISLEEISVHTKISTRILEAIESDRFELLPGGVFNRSFVLHYAHYLGLDESRVGAEYDLLVGAPQPVDVRQVAAQRQERNTALSRAASSEAGAGRRRAARIAVLSALLLGLCAYAALESLPGGLATWMPWWQGRAGASGPAAASAGPAAALISPAEASSTPEALPSPPTVPATSSPVQASANAQGDSPARRRLRLQVDTIHPSWTMAHADGRQIWEAVMRAGETRTVTADSLIELRVSNAGAVVLTLNGETLPPLGRKGEPRTVTFTPQDLNRQ